MNYFYEIIDTVQPIRTRCSRTNDDKGIIMNLFTGFLANFENWNGIGHYKALKEDASTQRKN